MSESVHTNTSLWSKGMKAVIVAQFLSAFGDNALLFATLALLKAQFYPEWSQPILQMVFVGAYILFAPFVGQVADSFAKGRVMMVANGLKLLGAVMRDPRLADWRIGNIDLTIVAQKPKLLDYNLAMRTNLARVLTVPLDRVSVKATTTEKLGFEGREEGISAMCVALLER